MKTVLDRIVRVLVWVALALCGLAFADFLLHPLAADFTYQSVIYRAVVMLVLTPLTLLVGFLIIRRVPGNIVGPLLILWAGTAVLSSLRKEIGQWPFTLFAFYEITIGWPALVLLVLHFPDGRIYPSRVSSSTYALFGLIFLVSNLIFFGNASIYTQWRNPFYLPALGRLNFWMTLLNVLIGLPLFTLALVSPALRYRKGSPLERQQIKWLALLGWILFLGTILGFVIYPLLTGGRMFTREDNLFSLLFFASMGLLPPLAIGIAVLRYRLWDIDIIIHRTLVYSMLTLILTAVYFGSVFLLQQLFELFTTQHQPPVATVLSTLAIAALFTPVRRRLQTFIDRRFYRRRYDAEQVLASLSAALRDEVDLDHQQQSILQVVGETMQPEHLSLWLRKPGPR